jgi:glycine/D-amino acid oxidase-like deaminating enzyme
MTLRSRSAVIIGGGIVGLACAWALRMCSVAVIDR